MIQKQIKNKIGIIYLDRPKALNALNCQMIEKIEEILDIWEKDPAVKAVFFDSKAEGGLSAGGDLKEIYENYIKNEKANTKDEFFKKEFGLNKYIIDYPKPIISHWYGVTMGGGIGLTIHSDLIIADETVNWAMPETSLGFVPDVSVGHYISKLPQALGQYVGLTGARIYPDDLVRFNLSDVLISSSDYEEVLRRLFELDTDRLDLIDNFKGKIKDLTKKLSDSDLSRDMEKIERYFGKNSVEEIITELKNNADDDFAKDKLEILEGRDPFMTKVQFEKYFLGKKLSRKDTLDLDLKIINHGLKCGSIEEGIRSVMIDKDKKPIWPIKKLEDVKESEIEDLLTL
ncbi:enoyl-CoA hydratase/isomerase family protein [uncultured Anaerococcus sp.]|uniref:enoyl-CoA hydratase/isomerase family protein n=1 Tax=uncultured Anaerococcus sp. TaxID=293428 RepID=UPI0025D6FB9B|nr:enoyl-CoA hydratase/isomerase family protein [uncultured Anaerococcus sp.]